MWGLGCVLAELLYCSDVYKNTEKDQRFLFRGKKCYPLSPRESSKNGDANESVSGDQLLKILNILGKQSREDASFITTKEACDYHAQLQTET